MNNLPARVAAFVTDRVVPAEPVLVAGGPAAAHVMTELQQAARAVGLWTLPLPAHLGGHGLDLTTYAPLAELEGHSDFGPTAIGSDLLLDATMLDRHATPTVRDRYLTPMTTGATAPSFAMTEPGHPGSDPSTLTTTATRHGDTWHVTGRKWFTSRAATAGFTTVVCRTDPDADTREAISLIVVPTDAPGYHIVREIPALGAGGQYEITLDVDVPADHLLGEPGQGLRIIGERLALGRTLRCLRWLGQADRAYRLMLTRLRDRRVHGRPLGEQQLLHALVFDSHADIAAARALTHAAVRAVAAGGDTRIAVGTAKVVTARALHAVVDRAIQIHGAEGLTDDTPLPMLSRAARAARILDGPDELHVTSVARRLLRGPR
jgi:alkylation response protein AidB-like acyl-CoA dehydrogenase